MWKRRKRGPFEEVLYRKAYFTSMRPGAPPNYLWWKRHLANVYLLAILICAVIALVRWFASSVG
jgi:hypothetical protein